METRQCTPSPEEGPAGQYSSAGQQLVSQGAKPARLSESHRSPLRLFVITILATFVAEVVAMVVVYSIEPLPYHLTTVIDAAIMTVLIFPVLYFFSFLPLIRQMQKSWQVETALLQSRQLQERFFDSIDTLIAYMDCEFNLIRVNDAYAKTGGHTKEYFTGKNHFALYPHVENQEIFQRVVETGEAYLVYEKPFEYPDHPEWGVTYWNWSLQPVRGTEGRVDGLVLSLVDVTERKRAEEKLRTAYDDLELRVQERTESLRLANISLENEIAERRRVEEILRYQAALLSNVNDAIIASDAQFRITSWNSAAESLYDWKAEEVIGRNGVEIVRTQWTGKDPEEMRRAITETGHWRGEATQVRKDGMRFPVDISSIVLYDDNRQIMGYVSVNRDITERKRVEEALRQSEQRLSRAQEIAHLGSWELDLANNRLTWSDEVYRIFGLEPQEFRASYEAFLEVVHPEDRTAVDEAYSNSIRDGKDGYEIEHRIIRPGSGEIRIVHEKCEHFRNESGQIIRSVGMVHDITERKQAEEALRRNEALLNQTGEMAKVGGWALDLQTNTLVWSLETYRIHELDRALQPTIETAIEFYAPEARAAITEAVTQAMELGKPYDLELPLITAKGRALWIRTIGQPEFSGGKCVRLFGTFQDITERKQVEAELRLAHDELELRVQERTEELAAANAELVKEIADRKDAERQLRTQATAMEAAANGIIITDCQGTIQWANPALLQMSGYDPAELIGQNMSVFRSDQQDEAYYRALWNTILAGKVWQNEITNRRKDGRLYVEEQTIAPVWNDHNQITQFIAIKQDITQRKQAEEALRESEEKFRTLVEWTYDWEIWLDPNGNIVYNSPACERITGYSPEEFRSTSDFILRIIHPDDRGLYKDHRQLVHIESVGPETIEYRIVTRDGKERWIQHVCRPLFGAEHRYLGRRISNRDITERKQAERDIQERNQKEKILTQTIHTMQLDIARDLHDTIGQNISFLRMKLDYLAERKIRKQAEMQIELRNMARAANESYDLMRGMLAMLQSENSTDLFRLFTRYAEQIKERASFKIDLSTQGEPRFVSAKRMRQLFYIFREILNNIEKHSNASQVTIQMTWESDCLKLLVFDNGSGFDLDSVQYGSHYGLRFMRERVELLNGSILIRSAIGSGTDIIVQIPYE